MNEIERFKMASEAFLVARELDERHREIYLDEHFSSDPELRSEIESLLAADEDPVEFVDAERKDLRAQLDSIHERIVDSDAHPGVTSATPGGALPRAFGDYELLRLIGVGGMGQVFEAMQSQPHRRVAIKMIQLDRGSTSLIQRFEREAHLLARLNHPGIAQIYGSGSIASEQGDQPYIAMEYVDGLPVDQFVRERDLDIRQRLTLVAQICEAVQHAHEQGVVHRDLKPSNILADEFGRPKILDFGVARAMDAGVPAVTLQTDAGQVIGTIPYMSPEQIAGDLDMLDGRSDVYTLGVLGFELLADRLPYPVRDMSFPDAARVIQDQQPTRLQSVDSTYRGDVDTIIAKALAKEPERRYASAGQMAEDIHRHLRHEPIDARPTSMWYRVAKFARREKTLVSGVAIAFVALTIGLILATKFAVSEFHLRRESEFVAARANLDSALNAIRIGEVDRADANLNAIVSRHRGWEWKFLSAQLDSAITSIDGEFSRPSLSKRPGRSQFASTMSDGSIGLFSLSTLEQLGELRAENPIIALKYSNDGAHLVTATEDGQILIWDAEAQSVIRKLDLAMESSVLDMDLSADETLVAVVTADTLLSVLHLEDGSLVRQLPLHTRSPQRRRFRSRLAFHPFEPVVATSASWGSSFGRMVLWNYETEEQQNDPLDTLDAVRAPVFSADGTLLAAASQSERLVHLWDGQSWEYRRSLVTPMVCSDLVFSADASRIFACGDGLMVWDVQADSVEVHRSVNTGVSNRLVVDEPAQLALTISGNSAVLWSLDKHEMCLVLRGHSSYVYALGFNHDGSLLATAAWDGTIRLWDTRTGDCLHVFKALRIVIDVAFSNSGRALVASNRRARQAWSMDTGQSQVGSADESFFDLILDGPSPVAGRRLGFEKSISIPLECKIIRNTITSLHSNSNKREVRSPAGTGATASSISSDGNRLVFSSPPASVSLLNLVDLEITQTQSIGDVPATAVAMSPDMERIAVGTREGTIQIWTGDLQRRMIEWNAHSNYIRAIAFSPDGTQLASVSGDFTVKIWDTVARSERDAQARREAADRTRMSPMVNELFDQLENPAAVAEQLRSDSSLSPDLRRAALRSVFLRSVQEDPAVDSEP